MTTRKDEAGAPGQSGQDGTDPRPPRGPGDRSKEAATKLDMFAWVPDGEQHKQPSYSPVMKPPDDVDSSAAGESNARKYTAGRGEGSLKQLAALEKNWAEQTPAALQDSLPDPTLSDVFRAVQS